MAMTIKLYPKYKTVDKVFGPVAIVQAKRPASDLTYGLLTKCEVKTARYWPSSFFLRVYGPRQSQGRQGP